MYTVHPTFIKRDDGLCIPMDRENADFRAYEDWLALGNVPDYPPPPTHADLVDIAKDEIRRVRQPVMDVLDGLQGSANTKGQQATADIIEEAKEALRNITRVDLSACETLAQMKVAVMTRYAEIAAASPALKLAFAQATQ